ncbi:XdhC family protein [Acrocarpospora macrocephala]|uniref:Xanthine dehydrogenase accessory factor n=1 Tax=Acrocarpospora macrocephala TaxID=150177 RepID=A0A5M3WED8_9ACTN|nr:XdhC family protein [Acrocarpospora macrocephala]GES06689.1 xanthine dehydrogenase accessory factor [Acrocarpospora macrocephala]
MAHVHDASCAVAHGEAAPVEETRTLVAVFASPMAGFLLKYGTDLGYRPILFEPDPDRIVEFPGVKRVTEPTAEFDETADVVVTDHHRDEIGPILRDVLGYPVRWIGIIGSPRHQGPHVQALTELGVAESEIARVHRPIGLDIGSRTPPEIAIATLAGLIADRNNRPGGFAFAR